MCSDTHANTIITNTNHHYYLHCGATPPPTDNIPRPRPAIMMTPAAAAPMQPWLSTPVPVPPPAWRHYQHQRHHHHPLGIDHLANHDLDNSYPLHTLWLQVLSWNHWWIVQRWYQTGRNDSFKAGSVNSKKESPLHTYTYNAFKVNEIINCECKTGKESENWYVTESSWRSSYHSMCNISTLPKRSKSTRNTRLQNIWGTASS